MRLSKSNSAQYRAIYRAWSFWVEKHVVLSCGTDTVGAFSARPIFNQKLIIAEWKHICGVHCQCLMKMLPISIKAYAFLRPCHTTTNSSNVCRRMRN